MEFDKSHEAWKEPGAHAGEDLWILKQFPKRYTGFAVELGALDGHYLSNTLLLEQKGWTVLCIEPNPIHHDDLKKNRKLVLTCACASRPQETAMLYADKSVYGQTLTGLHPLEGSRYEMVASVPVQVRTLDECLTASGFPQLDVLSLDVDGQEMDVLDGANLEYWKPRVVCVETVKEIGGLMMDAANAAIHSHLVALDYTLATKLGHNTLYVRAEE